MDLTDEKKPFDVEVNQDVPETMPDPDETLGIEGAGGRVWVVKIPKILMERWTNVRQEGIHLATIRVYHEARNKSGTKPRIVLFLPSATRSQTTPQWPVFNANAAVLTEGDEDSQVDMYDLEMINAAVDNQIVVAEIAKAPPPGSSSNKIPWNPRTRTTMATGKVVHSCNLKPVLSSAYRRQAAERAKMYNAPRASIKMIEQAGITGGRGGINRLTSGVGAGAPNAFGDLVKQKQKPAKGQFERMARIAKNELLDLLFSLFRDQPRWSLKSLRERTQQPESYLKEVLNEIGSIHRNGEFVGLWQLNEIYRDQSAKNEDGSNNGGLLSFHDSPGDIKMEDDGDDDDSDGDMEEIS